MIISSALFELIHSLSSTERAYFKKNTVTFSRKKTSNYLRIFDAITKQKNYNEEQLLSLFRKEAFIKQFSVAKNYLYNRILESMLTYHQTAFSETLNLMSRSDFLFEKGLYNQADKQLRMAEKIARRHELHSTLITICERQRFEQSIKKREPAEAGKNIELAEKEITLLNNHLAFSKLLAQTQHVYNRYGKTKNKKYLNEFKEIMRHPLLKNEMRAITFSSKRRYYDIHAVYNSCIGSEEKAFEFSKKTIQLFDTNPEKKIRSAIYYAGYINNTLLFCHDLKRYQEVELYLNKLSEIKHLLTSKYQQVRYFEIHSNNFLHFHNSTGQFDNANKILPSIIAELPQHENKIPDRDKLLLYGNIANTLFGLEDYKKCLIWINKARNEFPANVRPDIDIEISLLNILVHIELGHLELISHLAAAHKRLLLQKKSITNLEKHLIKFLKAISPDTKKETHLVQMADLKNKIIQKQKMKKRSAEQSPFFFDLLSWLESKIREISFSKVVRKKNQRYYE